VVDAFRVESLPENEQRRHGVLRGAYRIGMLISTAGARSGERLEGWVSPSKPPGTGAMWGGGAGADRHRHRAGGDRAGALSAGQCAHAQQKRFARVAEAAVGAFKISSALKWPSPCWPSCCCSSSPTRCGAMTAPFVIDLGFRATNMRHRQGRRLAALLAGGFAGGFIARAYPLATSLWIGGFYRRSPTCRSAGCGGRHRPNRVGDPHHGGEFH